MNGKSLLWKIPASIVGGALGLGLLLVGTAVGILVTPPARQFVLDKAIKIAEDKTGMDIDVGGLYLSPFHHSPMVIYRAYKGEGDFPLRVEIDSLFVGHRGQDTLIYVHALRLAATAFTTGNDYSTNGFGQILDLPIKVEELHLEKTTFHSDSLIAAVGIDAIVNNLDVSSPEINIAQGQYPLHGLKLSDTYVGIDLRDTPPDTTAQDTTPMQMAFEVPDGELRNVHFALTPLDIHVDVGHLSTNVLADVGGNRYDARRLKMDHLLFSLGDLTIPVDTIHGNANVDLGRNLITSKGLYVRSSQMGARANLHNTKMNLETMRVEVEGDAEYQGNKASLRAMYDIDDAAYDAHVEVEQVNLSPFLKDSTHVVIAGTIDAEGKGIDPRSRAMRSEVKLHLTDAIYDNIKVSGIRLNASLANGTVDGNLHLPVKVTGNELQVTGETEHQFHVVDFMDMNKIGVDYQTRMRNVEAHVADEDFQAQQLDLHFTTDSTTSLNLATDGLTADVTSPMHVMTLVDRLSAFSNQIPDFKFQVSNLQSLDTLRKKIPAINAKIALQHGSPAQGMIEKLGLDVDKVDLTLSSDSTQTDLALDAAIPEINHPEDSTAMRLPAAKAGLRLAMKEGSTRASVEAQSNVMDGAMMLHGLKTDVALLFEVERTGNDLNGTGRLTMDKVSFGEQDLGSSAVNMTLSRSEEYPNALRAGVQLDDIPLEIADSIIRMADLDLHGNIRAQAAIDGLPEQFDLSAEVLPLNVSARYKPYEVALSLGETPIVMKHNRVDFNGLPIYGADSTYLALTGGLDLNSMRLDIALAADSFAPVKLEKGGPIPVYGDLATDIRGSVTGPLDSIVADVDVTILPTTDITYPISKKNLAQVKPYGTVNVRYALADSVPLNLGGQVNVDDGFIRYSPKAYPIMPFHVDSGSNIAFNGPVGQTMLDISASQKVKADVQSEGEETRRVDFLTGVRVNGVVDSIGLNSIGFFLEAPEDETITDELASLDEDTREGLAATLLATGMYVGESNAAAQESGYALSSIINSRINAAMANSKLGKVVEIDFSQAQTEHASGKSNDMNIAISRSFFKDRLRLSLGTSLSDNQDAYKNVGFLNNISAEYKLTKDGMISLRAFGQRDYNNILEGELIKSGIGIRAKKEWRREELFRGDSLTRIYGLIADADIAWRSNNSLGPNLTLTSSIRNLFGQGEIFTLKGNGAYYWALRNRHPGDPKKTDTYKLGATASLVFPYLHWVGDNNPKGDTRYMLGYQYENIAGGYGVHKISGSFTYFVKTSEYITHAFTPFSLSVVLMKAETDSLLNKASVYPQLIKVIAGNEFVPSIGYNFIYNNYRSKRAVNTMLDLGFKESGNLINALYCIFGSKWNDKDKKLGAVTFNQFVKLTAELRNKFNITDRVCIATRLFAGANIPLGNSSTSPLSEAFYAGGPNSMRSASPYAYGPGNFYSEKYNQNFFHSGDVKLEANFELRFPIVWKLYGATFLDAGNVWDWYNGADVLEAAGITNYKELMQLREDLYDGIINNPQLLRQIALGTGAGLRLDLDGLVIRLDLGVAIHAPYQTYKYIKGTWDPDYTKPINTYFNIPSALDAIRVNFGIGYPF